MGRFFAALLCCVMLMSAPRGIAVSAQPVFFSMLFPQLIPDCLRGEAQFFRAWEVSFL